MGQRKRVVYLFGPVREHEVHDVVWRNNAKARLESAGAVVLDPVRGHKACAPGEVYGTNELLHRDAQDIRCADILVGDVQIGDYDRQSVGTFAELGMAYILGGKLIALCSNDERVRNHQFVRGICTMVFEDFDDMLDFVSASWLG